MDHAQIAAAFEEPVNAVTYHSTYWQMPEVLRNAYTILSDGAVEDHTGWSEVHAPHHAASQEAILATAQVALDRTETPQAESALIFGPGNCYDIPLEEIAASFGHTVLVGLPMTDTQKVIERLPVSLQQKIELVAADLTGAVGTLMTPLISALEQQNKFYELYKAAMPILTTFESNLDQVPDLGAGRFAFVSSQLIMTQLDYAPRVLFKDYVAKKYEIDLSQRENRRTRGLERAWQGVTNGLRVTHVNYLAQLVSDTGTVHFADTYPKLHEGVESKNLSPRPEDIAHQELDRLFEPLLPQKTWPWTVSEKYRHRVVTQSLAPRRMPTADEANL